jgi:hypothetical protein
MDYNCVIKTIKITNEEGIWTSEESEQFIMKNYKIEELPYGQVIHIWNVNESGDEWNDFFVVYDNKLVDTRGDQYFRLHYDFTKNITDICAKYPEYTFTDILFGCCLPKELHSQEDEYQSMNGEISGDDVYILKNYGKTFGKVPVFVDWDGSVTEI